MRTLLLAAVSLAVTGPALGAKGAKPDLSVRWSLEVLGFAPDGAFGWCVSAVDPGARTATAKVHALTAEGDEQVWATLAEPLPSAAATVLRKVQAQARSRTGAFTDQGAEQYTSGTATASGFAAGGKAYRVALEAAGTGDDQAASVSVARRRGAPVVVARFQGGSSYALNSLLLSRDGASLAVVVKRTRQVGEAPYREFVVGLARLGTLPEPPPLPAGPPAGAGAAALLELAEEHLDARNAAAAKAMLDAALAAAPEDAAVHYALARASMVQAPVLGNDACGTMGHPVFGHLRDATARDRSLARRARSEAAFEPLKSGVDFWKAVGDPLTDPQLVRSLLSGATFNQPAPGVIPLGSILLEADGTARWAGPPELDEDGRPVKRPSAAGSWSVGRDGTVRLKVDGKGEATFRAGDSITLDGVHYSFGSDCGV